MDQPIPTSEAALSASDEEMLNICPRCKQPVTRGQAARAVYKQTLNGATLHSECVYTWIGSSQPARKL